MAKDKHGDAEEKASSTKMSRKEFEKKLAKLQIELIRLQTWVQATGARIIVVFEGRDTAGKGGVINRITARTNPRVYRHVALPAPPIERRHSCISSATSDISQRRAKSSSSTAHGTTERVMGFCTEEEAEHFLFVTPAV